jgi:flagellar motility protein MotE (MotC chaperone)
MAAYYYWRVGARIKLDPQKAGEHLLRLTTRHNGSLSAGQVLEEGRDPDNFFNTHFEWDDSAAAEKHRLDQARQLLNCIVMVDEAKKIVEPTRVFVSLKTIERQAYIPLMTIMTDPKLRQATLDQALRELERFKEKYRHLKELADIFAALDAL